MVKATVGILGGMGPAATVSFFDRLVKNTPATSDQEHLKVVVLNDPTVPDRTAHLLGQGESPAPQLIAGVLALQDQGVDLIAIPCNTAHYFLEEMRAAVQIPILDIVQETIGALRQTCDSREVGLLSTAATARLDLYGPALKKAGFTLHLPDQAHQDRVTEAIRLIKARGDLKGAARLQEETLRYFERVGAGAAILACTELGLVDLDPVVPVVDSLEALAISTVGRATQWELDSHRSQKRRPGAEGGTSQVSTEGRRTGSGKS